MHGAGVYIKGEKRAHHRGRVSGHSTGGRRVKEGAGGHSTGGGKWAPYRGQEGTVKEGSGGHSMGGKWEQYRGQEGMVKEGERGHGTGGG